MKMRYDQECQILYDEERSVFRECRFCLGRGCLACPGEADRAYKLQFPDGPKPFASMAITDETTSEQIAQFIKGHVETP
jgi:hypothetical protein